MLLPKSKLVFSALFIILILIKVNCIAADIQRIGVPYVQNYTKVVYQAGNQNWSVVSDNNGVLYFGNAEGLQTFDGRYWQLYHMPNKLIVRAVAADNRGKIYVGGFGELGYWAYNKQGLFKYNSLTNLIPVKFELKDEIWKIYVDGNRVIFQSFASIFIYEGGKMKVVKANGPYLFLFKCGSRFLVEILSQGLFELKGSKLQYIENSNVLGNTGVLSILPYKKNKGLLIGTAKNGLFIYDEQGIRPLISSATTALKTFQLNNGILVLDKYYAFGTILNGIYIVDEGGNLVQHIDKTSGLQNNTVLSLYADKDQNLWAGLDNGIDRIEINSPLYYYFDKTGKFGTVYSSLIHDNKIYLGTNQGLFYSNWPGKNPNSFQTFDFKFIENSQGQVWDLALIDGQLLCGHNEGTFLVNGSSIKKISNVNGGWVIKKLSSSPDFLIQGTYTGLVLYKKDKTGQWAYYYKIDQFGEPSKYVEQDNKGNIWISHAYKGLYQLKLSADLKTAETIKYYDHKSGLTSAYNVNAFNLNNRILFSSVKGFLAYDDINDGFFPFLQLNSKLGSFASSNKIIKARNDQYWFINHGKVALADFSNPGRFTIDSNHFSILNGRMVQHYENISQISDGIYLISVDDGFVIFNADNAAKYQRFVLPKVLIRRVQNTTNAVSLLTEVPSVNLQIPYNRNNLLIAYSLPYYGQAKVRYQYSLSKSANKWSEWSEQSLKEFTNLSAGKYRFTVRAIVNGVLSPSNYFEFEVLPPWYSTVWAKIIYIILALALVLGIRLFYQYKLRKHQEEISQKLHAEKEEYLKQESIANEQQIIRIKNEQLQKELDSKSRELANSAMNIVYKNELLQKIHDELIKLKDDTGNKLSPERLRKIQNVIDEGMSDERDWNIFETSFNEAHENFFKKLKNGHPQLIPNDLKMCAYLRMNMNSKEIASLLNISLRGVEIRRYRLRKKLNLEHDKNLVEFLIEI
ncbi:MAG: hypothetical protein JWQ25_714 [Daejeonella sp.]|nr:hypothetical protein [Daejeonella sp.]